MKFTIHTARQLVLNNSLPGVSFGFRSENVVRAGCHDVMHINNILALPCFTCACKDMKAQILYHVMSICNIVSD